MLKYFLYPFSFFYGAVMAFRNHLFDIKLLRSVRFDFPLISIGNLTVGGTGKTPHTEYLIHFLQYIMKVATLSRGYGRRTTGFLIADASSTAAQIGDEPCQFKLKYPETMVAVSEDRVMAVPRLLNMGVDIDVILLDDAFQHRSIRPGLQILLTEFELPFTRDSLLPAGRLRESASSFYRADIIIVTKCPPTLSIAERDKLIKEISPYKYQKVYFSQFRYGALYSLLNREEKVALTMNDYVLLLTGIANPQGLLSFLKPQVSEVELLRFADHHNYDSLDMETIRRAFQQLSGNKKCIVTTEKDATRLMPHAYWFLKNDFKIYVQPVEVAFLHQDKWSFESDIMSYIELEKQQSFTKPNTQTTP
ncbi:MAG: tetraacyldisaccharide 4'-kinase [Bacteroidetes bacterium]|nr:tetraacyldisaccharide 4'-kinase [Bacteroidota bacterium]